MSSYDVIVIGAGIEGSASAYHLAKKGKKVLLLEQFPLPHARGSSHGQSRITRYAYPEDFYVHMMLDCFPMWAKLEEESGEDFFLNCGVIDIRQMGSADCLQLTNALKKHSVPHELLNPKEIKSRFPMFELGENLVVVLDPSGGLLRADRALRAFQSVFKQLGGTIKDQSPVSSILPGDIVKVYTNNAVFTAKNVVVAAGAWSGKFTKSLGLNVPLQPQKVIVLYWKISEGKEELHGSARLPCFIHSANGDFDLYGLPAEEYPGLVKFCFHSGPPTDPDQRDIVDTDWVINKAKDGVKILPWLDDTPVIMEYCMYTNTPDHNPFIDRHPQYSNIVIAAGFSGHGFKLAPAVGNAVSELVLGLPPSYNMSPFKLNRFNTKSNL